MKRKDNRITDEVMARATKMAERLGRPIPSPDDIQVMDGGVIVITTGKPNIEKLVKKALAL